jgi:hypothetical protein
MDEFVKRTEVALVVLVRADVQGVKKYFAICETRPVVGVLQPGTVAREKLDETGFFYWKIPHPAARHQGFIGIVRNNLETLRRRGQAVVQTQMGKTNETNHRERLALA